MPDEDANNPRVKLTELDQGMNGSLENILPFDGERNVSLSIFQSKIKKWNKSIINCLMTIFVLVAILITVNSVQKSSSHLTKAVTELQNSRSVRIDTLLKSRRLWTTKSSSDVMTVTPSTNSVDFMDVTQCFKKGTCQNGHLLDHYKADNLSLCMANCVSNDECQWTSFDFDFHYCTLFSSCPTVDVDPNRLQSISSRTDCPLEIPCNVPGRCEGSVLKIQITKHQCHLTCQQNDACNWYSFGENVCIMFSTCINVDVSRNNFTTQHSTCPESMLFKWYLFQKL